MKEEISFRILDDGTERNLTTYAGEYRNLMFLLKDRLFLEDFGECGGMGRCATCVIEINGLSGNSLIKERNEPTTLSKIGYNGQNFRLACQLFVTEELDESVIKLVEM